MLMTYIIGIPLMMVPVRYYLEDITGETPNFARFLVGCIAWPSTVFVGMTARVIDLLTRTVSGDTEYKLVNPTPAKDPYLLAAEREVDAFLEYKDIPEAQTAQEFERIEKNKADIKAVNNRKPTYDKYRMPSQYKSIKAYNQYLVDIEREKIEYVNLYKNKKDAHYSTYTTPRSYYGDY
jgi:hypothetical protein